MIIRIIKIILYLISSLLIIPLTWLIMVLLGALIPAHTEYEQATEGLDVFVSTNGRHTFFVIPSKTRFLDWTKIFPPDEFPIKLTNHSYISLGWGDRAYYTEARSFDKLNLKLALKALFLPTASAVRVEYLSFKPGTNENYYKLKLTHNQFQLLSNYVYSSIQIGKNGKGAVINGITRNKYDRFYEAKGQYHIFNTSNNWTNRALKKMQIPSPLWSPLEDPIIWHLKKTR